MKCPFCHEDNDRVLDTRPSDDGGAIRRRRECLDCKRRFTTYERIEVTTVKIVKKDGVREPFDRSKIKRGLETACWKRPVSDAQLESIISEVENDLEMKFESEVPSRQVGEIVMQRLRDLDPVAYVRFASVYRQFKDARDFVDEIKPMLAETRKKESSPEGRSHDSGSQKRNLIEEKEFRVLILLTNDDGIYAPGLAAIERQLRLLGEVVVVAPATEQSGVGHSITYLTPLTVKEVFHPGQQARRPAARLGRRGQPGRLREDRRASVLPPPARSGRQRHQLRPERGHQRALLGHGGGGHRRGVLRHHQRGRFAGIRRARPLRQSRRAGEKRSSNRFWRKNGPSRSFTI